MKNFFPQLRWLFAVLLLLYLLAMGVAASVRASHPEPSPIPGKIEQLDFLSRVLPDEGVSAYITSEERQQARVPYYIASYAAAPHLLVTRDGNFRLMDDWIYDKGLTDRLKALDISPEPDLIVADLDSREALDAYHRAAQLLDLVERSGSTGIFALRHPLRRIRAGLIANAGFEFWENGVPEGWTVLNGQWHRVVRSVDVFKERLCGLRMTGGYDYLTVEQSVRLKEALDGRGLRATVWAWSQNPAASVNLTLAADGHTFISESHPGDGEWHMLEATLPPGAAAGKTVSVVLGHGNRPMEGCVFDDVFLEILPGDQSLPMRGGTP
jgi:hypothetical protein